MTVWQPFLVLCLCFPLVVVSIEFLTPPLPTAINLGQDLVLDCIATDTTENELSYLWEFNSQPIYTSLPQARTFSNNSLFVPRVTSAALGNYTCVVQFTGFPGTAVRSVQASVVKAYIDNFRIHPSSQTVPEGSGITLQCVTGRSAPPAVIYWEKDGIRFTGGDQINGTFGMIGQGGATQKSLRLQLSVTPQTGGTYACVAINPLTNEEIRSTPAILEVQLVPRIPQVVKSPPSSLISAESQPFMMSCQTVGWPEPDIVWTRDNQDVINTTRVNILSNGTLHFAKLWSSDAGLYRCNATNEIGSSVSDPTDLVVAILDVPFVRSPTDIQAVAGQSATLPCSPPRSIPAATVQWFKNNAAFTLRTGEFAVIKQTSGALLFTNVQLGDSGTYFCVAINEYASPNTRTSRAAMLTVEGSPIFTEPPVPTRVVKDDLLTLHCRVEGLPQPSITWYREGVPLSIVGRISVRDNNQELLVSDVNKADEGQYRCQAANVHGNARSPPVLVTVVVPPEIVQSVENAAVRRGEDAHLRCVVWGDPRPVVVWYKDDVLVNLIGRFTETEDGLKITNVVMGDTGTYRCEATNEGGSKSSQGNLLVQTDPFIVTYPEDQIVRESTRVILHCDATGVPEPTYTWLYNNNSALPSGVMMSSEGRTLIIQSAVGYMSGIYTCQAQNSVGLSSRSSTLFVQVAPDVLRIEGTTVVDQGRDLELTCLVTGVPRPEVRWSFEGLRLLATPDLRVAMPKYNSLRIRYLTKSEAGDYRCEAVNVAGTDTGSVQVDVQDTPLPPLLRSVEPMSKTSVNMSWVAATQHPNVQVTAFVIQYKERLSLVFETYDVNIPPYITWYEVSGLQPATDYVFQVAAKNSLGIGVYSSTLGATTLETAPSEPRNLRMVSRNSTSVTIQWEIPVSPNGDIRTYQVQYRRKFTGAGLTLNSGDYSVLEVAFPTFPLQRFTIPNLRPFTTYVFRIRAATIENENTMWGTFSSEFMVTTEQAAPGLAPGNLQTVGKTPRIIQVSWDPIPTEETNGILRGYIVLYKLAEDPSNYRELQTGASGLLNHTANITGLLPWQRYEIRVIGYTDGGRSALSPPQFETTFPDSPSAPPEALEVVAVDKNSMVIRWRNIPWSQQNSEITGYQVQYQRQPDGEVFIKDVGNPNMLQTNISGLVPYSLYNVKVQAYTTQLQGRQTGFSPFTETLTVTTLQGVPGPVQNVSIDVQAYSVYLSWLPPENPNGEVTKYVITFASARQENTLDAEANVVSNIKDPDHSSHQKRAAKSANNDVIISVDNDTTQVETSDTSVNITGLEPGTTYIITVAAETDGGLSEQPIRLTVTTLAGPTILPPASIPTTSSPTEPLSTSLDPVTMVTSTTEATGGLSSTQVAIIVGCLVGAVLIMIVITVLALVLCHQRGKKKKSEAKYFVPPPAFNQQSHATFVTSNAMELKDSDRSKTVTINGATETYTLSDDQHTSGITTGYDTATTTGYATSATYAASSVNGTAGSLAQFSDVSMMVNPGASLGRSHSEGADRPKPVRAGYHGNGYLGNSTSTPAPSYYLQTIPLRTRVVDPQFDMSYSSMDDLNLTHIPENRLRNSSYPYPMAIGQDNPAYESDLYGPELISTPSMPGVYESPFRRGLPLHTSMELYQEGNMSKRRMNRMKSNTAAAIAAQRNRITSVYEDTDSLINNESVVVYDERTAL